LSVGLPTPPAGASPALTSAGAQSPPLPFPRLTVSDLTVRLQSLHLYPVKSCAGIARDVHELDDTGLDLDRAWMVVDEHREFLSQRELPRLALVQPTLRASDLVLRAPGMLALHLALDRVEAPCRVRVWDDEVDAFDMGELAAQWFGDYLGRRARLVRFDPDARRLADKRWTGAIDAPTQFADAFPLLVVSAASLDALNRRLAQPVTLARFRPNLVLDGIDAHAEDYIDEIAFDGGAVRLKLVKPCTRCSVPDVDPLTAETGHAVGDALAAYRADARMGGALTFGMNAIVLEGAGRLLRAGMTGEATLAV
jgi:uncharacterized protein YcbX